ncbi:hypothetical protein [Flavobacterium sp.]|uniref:hypothetical protein n=1 Tax=Flavobacterium sp. TaxID=239 RepID=UPI0025BFB11D|nr:hypothetical protein [Flavobacterium sp.]
MNFQQINSFIAPLGLIIAGLIMRLSTNQVMFGKVKKYWLSFIITGSFLLLTRVYEHWFA